MNEEERVRKLLTRHDLAFKISPVGSWFERWIPGVCQHRRIRCTHGDEIVSRRFRRQVCMICGRGLKGPLPYLCFFTDEPHEKVNE